MKDPKNNIGVLRLMLASLVIVSHAPEMIDGDRFREVLYSITGTMSLGDLCVDGFFLLSGYLITQSMVRTGATIPYLISRVLRIYPAFIVCFLLCVFALAPALHAQVGPQLKQTFITLVLLGTPPVYAGQMPGLELHNQLNWSMWTIGYEFRCYLMVAFLGSIGLLSRRWAILGLTIVMVAAHVVSSMAPPDERMRWAFDLPYQWQIMGGIPENLRLMSHFLIGASFYLYRDVLEKRLTGKIAGLSAAIMVVGLFHLTLADAAAGVFGVLPLFWLAFRADLGAFQRINDQWDISYGVYLYGWPIGISLHWAYPGLSPWVLAGITLPFAFMCGALSWRWVEKPAKSLRQRFGRGKGGGWRTAPAR